jgi:hypothetical protein
MVDFLENPLVQYIPIRINNPIEGVWQNPLYNDPDIFVSQDIKDLSNNLSQLRLPQISFAFQHNLAIIALNFKVEKIYYRFHTIKLIGQRKQDNYHIFSITNKYFPKHVRILHFSLFTQVGEKLAWKNIKVSNLSETWSW